MKSNVLKEIIFEERNVIMLLNEEDAVIELLFQYYVSPEKFKSVYETLIKYCSDRKISKILIDEQYNQQDDWLKKWMEEEWLPNLLLNTQVRKMAKINKTKRLGQVSQVSKYFGGLFPIGLFYDKDEALDWLVN